MKIYTDATIEAMDQEYTIEGALNNAIDNLEDASEMLEELLDDSEQAEEAYSFVANACDMLSAIKEYFEGEGEDGE